MADYNVKEKVTVNGRTFFVMRVKAEDIELVNFGYHGSRDVKTLTEAGIIGMNGCFFGNTSSNQTTLNNIVYQSGKPLGSHTDDTDAKRNQTGKAVIYWTGTALKYAENISTSSDLSIPTAKNSWVQGGIGLYFGKTNWKTLMKNSMPAADWNDLSGTEYRTAMVAKTAAKDVYLFACPKTKVSFDDLRKDILKYFGVTETTASAYKGIALDGGISTQIRGYDKLGVNNIEKPLIGRAVPQVIKNTYLSK